MNKTNKQKLHSCQFRKICRKGCFDCLDCNDWKHDKQVRIKNIDGGRIKW